MTMLEILEILDKEFPNVKSELEYETVFQLLIAVTLSAQTTDVAVNKVTKNLFALYPDAQSLAQADPSKVQEILREIGMYRNKTKFIIAASQALVEHYDGEVPQTRKELESLPGVGRKTANVVLSEGFGIPAIAVDTHVARVTKRLGFADEKDSVLKVEQKLQKLIPKEMWHQAHHLLLLFGRYHSTASNQEDIYMTLNRLKEKHKDV